MRLAHPLAASLVIAAIAACSAGLGPVRADPPGATLPPVQWVGQHSKRTEPGFILVRDEKAWLALWASHSGEDVNARRNAAPKVDFGRCIVLAHFRGSTVNCDGETVRAIEDLPGMFRVRFVPDTFQSASFSGEDRGIPATPFGIWVIPSPPADKPLVIEEGAENMLGNPITWREVHRITPR